MCLILTQVSDRKVLVCKCKNLPHLRRVIQSKWFLSCTEGDKCLSALKERVMSVPREDDLLAPRSTLLLLRCRPGFGALSHTAAGAPS